MRPAALIAFFALPFAAIAQSSPETHAAAVTTCLLPAVQLTGQAPDCRTIAAEMAKMHVPAVSIAVIHGGKVEWAKGFGVQSEGGTPVFTSTLFQAASISKSFTAMAALKLVEQKKLSLDAPIQTELKSWTLPANAFTAEHPVTLRELLSHTAGTSVHGFIGYGAGKPLPTLTQILNGEKPANSAAIVVEAMPGEKYEYSGGGYVIVQQSIIDATGKPFADVMKSTVLAPVGMTASTFQQPLDPARMSQVAMPVGRDGLPIPGAPNTYPELAAAGLWTTPSDLAKWVIEMQRSLAGKGHVLTTEMMRTMVTPVKDDYGLGVEVHGAGDKLSFAHSGGNVGYQCYYIGYANGDGAVIMTASENGTSLISEVQRSLAKVYGWPDFQQVQRTAVTVPVEGELQYAGAFTAKGAFPFAIKQNGDHLEMIGPYGPPQPLLNTSPSAFFVMAGNVQVVFDTPDSGTLFFGRNGEQKVPFARRK